MNTKFAVIDLGTNTFHLLLAEQGIDGIKIFHNEKLPIMLGANGISKGVIGQEAMQRGIEGVAYFHKKISMHNIKFIYASATSAVRNATNGAEFLEKIKSKTGINIEVISGEREAELIYSGVKSALIIGNEKVLVMDIGGMLRNYTLILS